MAKKWRPCIKKLLQIRNKFTEDHVGVIPLKLNGKVSIDSAEKADALNSQFYLVFTNEDLTNLPPTDSEPYISMCNISFSIDGIANLPQSLQVAVD